MAIAALFRFFVISHGTWVILFLVAQAQEQAGFLNIDCGLPGVLSYTDETSGITYVSDTNFTEYGENREISPNYRSLSNEQQFRHLRSFPRGLRNCYSLKPSRGQDTRYFIKARFMYGNYDNKNKPPIFDLYLGVDLWDTVKSEYGSNVSKGIIHMTSPDHIDVCLINTGFGTPFISVLEFWPLNGVGIYELKEISGQHTDKSEKEAILGVKYFYGLKRFKWQGDPCGPEAYRWDGLTCSYTKNSPSRIISLNLASSGLNGEIAPSIANMSKLESLDLSNNNLTGKVPEYLAHLPLLKLLNLRGNKHLSGPVPAALLSKQGLTLSVDLHLTRKNDSCLFSESNKIYVIAPVQSLNASSALLFFLLLIVAVVYFIWKWCKKRKKRKSASDAKVETVKVEPKVEDLELGTKTQQLTYSDIQKITSNFQRVVGEGGFGKVYHGYLNGNEVAVKMISSSSIQGHRQFVAELKLLLRVHHKNLTTLVGYCNDETNFGLIYEYMAMGNLRSHLLGSRNIILNWEDRLRIAIDTAQGLEYLHNGCKPPIIHRDVKTTNILLNDMFQAKLGDFGLSKIFPLDSGNHRPDTASTFGITASVAGTPGYLDPEYYESNWLNEKSDVYSFGVVLLELITARPVLTKPRENISIIYWVTSKLTTGDINSIIDPRLRGNCDINGVWKTVEIAMSCVSKSSTSRPTMSRVVTELKDCSTMARRGGDSSVEMISKVLSLEFSPLAR